MAAVPRNFKLLDELEDAEKSSKGGADISLGLQRPDDTYMSDWTASIFQAAGHGGEHRIWFLAIRVDDNYPKSAPVVKFTSRISADFVDARGNVLAAKVAYLNSWNGSKTMHGVLAAIKDLIAKAPRAQPAEGSTY